MSVPCSKCYCELSAVKFEVPTVETISKKCLEFFNETLERISSKSRKRDIVQKRMMCISACRDFTSASLKDIAYYFGGRDHTTAIHSIQTIKDLCDYDDNIRAEFVNLKNYLKK